MLRGNYKDSTLFDLLKQHLASRDVLRSAKHNIKPWIRMHRTGLRTRPLHRLVGGKERGWGGEAAEAAEGTIKRGGRAGALVNKLHSAGAGQDWRPARLRGGTSVDGRLPRPPSFSPSSPPFSCEKWENGKPTCQFTAFYAEAFSSLPSSRWMTDLFYCSFSENKAFVSPKDARTGSWQSVPCFQRPLRHWDRQQGPQGLCLSRFSATGCTSR